MTTLTDRELLRAQARFVAMCLGQPDEYAATSAQIGCHYDGNIKGAMVYTDDVVQIVADTTSMALFVNKVENRNPVVSTKVDGASVRNHGELMDHMRELARKAVDASAPATL